MHRLTDRIEMRRIYGMVILVIRNLVAERTGTLYTNDKLIHDWLKSKKKKYKPDVTGDFLIFKQWAQLLLVTCGVDNPQTTVLISNYKPQVPWAFY